MDQPIRSGREQNREENSQDLEYLIPGRLEGGSLNENVVTTRRSQGYFPHNLLPRRLPLYLPSANTVCSKSRRCFDHCPNDHTKNYQTCFHLPQPARREKTEVIKG